MVPTSWQDVSFTDKGYLSAVSVSGAFSSFNAEADSFRRRFISSEREIYNLADIPGNICSPHEKVFISFRNILSKFV